MHTYTCTGLSSTVYMYICLVMYLSRGVLVALSESCKGISDIGVRGTVLTICIRETEQNTATGSSCTCTCYDVRIYM